MERIKGKIIMKISTKGIYALEILTDLAMHSEADQPESLKNIAGRRLLSEKYLERIVKSLKDAGLISSVRGTYGGYCLSRAPGEIRVKDVLNAVEGELTPVECLTKETSCRIDCDSCPTRETWAQMWRYILRVTEEVTVEDIVRKTKNEKQVLTMEHNGCITLNIQNISK